MSPTVLDLSSMKSPDMSPQKPFLTPITSMSKDRAFLTKTGSEQILTCRQARHQNIRGTGEGAALIDGERRVGGRALREVNVAAAGDDAFRGNVAGA